MVSLERRSYYQIFPEKPTYLNMATVLPSPSYLSGFLHELGRHSGVYSYVSLPRRVENNQPRIKQHGRLDGFPSLSPASLATSQDSISCKRVSKPKEEIVKRKNMIKRKISSSNKKEKLNRRRLRGPNNSFLENTDRKYEFSDSSRFDSSPTLSLSYHKKKQSTRPESSDVEKPLQLEEWTEKLLEEARDDLEMVDVGVQTEESVADKRSILARSQGCQTGLDLDFVTQETSLVVAALISQTMKQSLVEVLEEEQRQV